MKLDEYIKFFQLNIDRKVVKDEDFKYRDYPASLISLLASLLLICNFFYILMYSRIYNIAVNHVYMNVAFALAAIGLTILFSVISYLSGQKVKTIEIENVIDDDLRLANMSKYELFLEKQEEYKKLREYNK